MDLRDRNRCTLHDVGKPILTLLLPTSRRHAQPKVWQPLTAMLPGAHYRFRFNPQREYHRHELMPPLLVHRLLPQVGLNWLASEPAVFDAWLATISGTEDAGPLANDRPRGRRYVSRTTCPVACGHARRQRAPNRLRKDC